MTSTLQAEALAAERGGRTLFRGLSFTLEPGRVIWLRGANGRGKTTLLRGLAGLATLSEGRVLVDGRAPDAALRAKLLWLGHANALAGELRVAEGLRFLAALAGRPATAGALDAALARLGLPTRRHAFVRTLSQGQRRRAALARLALPDAPPLWLLDEPYDALDADGCRALDSLLAEHAARGGSALVTSHVVPPAAGSAEPLDLDAHAPPARR